MEIGTQIQALRDDKKISKEQMADYLGISINTYKKIEYGERMPTVDEIKIISEKLEIDPSFFFTKSGNTFIQSGTNYPGVFGNGNIVTIPTSLLESIVKTMEQNNVIMSKLSMLIDKMMVNKL